MKNLRVIFMGTPEFAVPILKMLDEETNVVLVVTQPDKKVGRKHIITPSPIKEYAINNNIEVFQPTKLKEDYQKVLDTPCDIIITCAFGQILPKEILDYPKLGCVNVHASLLPKYRGGAPIHWCLINGEEETGITIMYMDPKMDAGDIISQETYKITSSDNVLTLHQKLSLIGANLLKDTLPEIILGTNKRIKQDETKVSYGFNVKREDEHLEFTKTGGQLLWQIRGLNPWPLANFLLDDKEYKVLEATFTKKKVDDFGVIVEITKSSIGITCQDGVLYITKLKPFGKQEMTTQSFLNGIKKEQLLYHKVN